MEPGAASSRRRFLASLGGTGAMLATASWLEAIGYAQGGRGPARALIQASRAGGDFDRRVLGVVSRASGQGRLHRRVPARLATGRRERLPHRRGARGQGARRPDHPVSRREFRVRLQLARRRRPEGAAADACSSGRGTRSRPTSSAPTSSSTGAALVGTEPLLGMNFGTGTAEMAVAYVEYCNVDRRHEVERPAAVARLRAAAQRALLVSRQRDGRAVADRPAAGARIRPQGARCRAADACRRPRAAADRLRIERHRHAAPTWSGIARCSKSATTRSTAFRCTPITATRRR